MPAGSPGEKSATSGEAGGGSKSGEPGVDSKSGETGSGAKSGEAEIERIEVTSSAFANGQRIPKKYTADGADVSPPLSFGGLPAGTEALALIMDDPDAPGGTWVHWVVYDLPGDTRSLAEGAARALPSGAKHGKNSWGKLSYGGPSPPPGKPHRYFFKVYALASGTDLPAGATKEELLESMRDRILARGTLMGRYSR